MLREGIARAKASLQKRETGGRKSGHGQRGRELTEVRRLSELDLGEGASFAELAETCLDLEEGVRGNPVWDGSANKRIVGSLYKPIVQQVEQTGLFTSR